jgi:hypothetical protein
LRKWKRSDYIAAVQRNHSKNYDRKWLRTFLVRNL